MVSTTVRIKEETHQTLKELAEQDNLPMQEVLGKAVEAYRRWRLLEATNAGYAAMRADPEVWKEELEERALWEATLGDGLADD